MDATNVKKFKLDASALGCTGMFWRTKPEKNMTASSASDWPRNGATLQGWHAEEHPGWVKIDHPEGYWMPVKYNGTSVMTEITS